MALSKDQKVAVCASIGGVLGGFAALVVMDRFVISDLRQDLDESRRGHWAAYNAITYLVDVLVREDIAPTEFDKMALTDLMPDGWKRT